MEQGKFYYSSFFKDTVTSLMSSRIKDLAKSEGFVVMTNICPLVNLKFWTIFFYKNAFNLVWNKTFIKKDKNTKIWNGKTLDGKLLKNMYLICKKKKIYQASFNCKNIEVTRLQKILIQSKAAKLKAIRKITQDNKGKKNIRCWWNKKDTS